MNQTSFSLDTYRIKGKKFAVNVDDPNNATINSNRILCSTDVGALQLLSASAVTGVTSNTEFNLTYLPLVLAPTSPVLSIQSAPPAIVSGGSSFTLGKGTFMVQVQLSLVNLDTVWVSLSDVNNQFGTLSSETSPGVSILGGIEDRRTWTFFIHLATTTSLFLRINGVRIVPVNTASYSIPVVRVLKTGFI